ncbi:MAG TPA: DUF3515 family protein [Cellulomonas sp.]
MPRRPAVQHGAVVALAAVLLAGCSSAVPVTPATHATDPDCASLILATPDSLGDGLGRRHTTAQATTAWGDPAIVLRCGVEPPGPTTERCETVTSADGPSVDWLVVQDDGTDDEATDELPAAAPTPATAAPTATPAAPADAASDATATTATDWTFTTYGRVPAVEVHVPAAVAAERSTTFLDGLGPAIVAHTQQQRSCL